MKHVRFDRNHLWWMVTVALLMTVALGMGLGPVWAQPSTPPATPPMDWKTLVAALANTIITLGLVQIIKRYLPGIRLAVPWLFPILAAVIGPALALAQTWIAQRSGIGVDLSPIIALFSGASATALHQVGVQVRHDR